MKEYAKVPRPPAVAKPKAVKPGEVPASIPQNKGKSKDIRSKVK